jgi:flavin reductase (DIM6/NTAB) family NADH-FMN oxidoreductase RutF
MALARIPAAMWVATAAHEGRRRSIRAVFVQQAAISPVLISVALPRGPTLAPLIRETGVLGLSLLSREERYMTKRWEDKRRGLDDLLDGPEAITLTTGVPLLKRALLVLEGRIVRHLDLEADHELFILQILGGRALNPESSPARRKRAHGLET